MASTTETCNLALSHLGVGKRIASLTESGREAEACNLFYEHARDELLRDFPWPFAKRNAYLGLVTTLGDSDHPTTEWQYSYRYPSDCLLARKILSEVRNDSRSSRWSYDLAADDQGTLIYSDKEEANLEYTSTLAQNPARWHSDFTMALSYRLAAYIAPLLSKGDPFKVGDKAMALWMRSNAKAMANAGNEVQMDEAPESDFILARG
jgi:hypothetical protein